MDLPIDLQKLFVPMIVHGQKPLVYSGYGFVYLNLETFCKVIWTLEYRVIGVHTIDSLESRVDSLELY